jgi:hypothetical protein
MSSSGRVGSPLDAAGVRTGGVERPAAGGLAAGEAQRLIGDALRQDDAVAVAVGSGLVTPGAVDSVQRSTPRRPDLLESATTWAGQTARGYATGAVNTVLDAANLLNTGVNAALGAAGAQTRLRTDMRIEPGSRAEGAAQDAVTVGSAVAGVAGAVRSGPALARALDGTLQRGRAALGGEAGVARASAAGAAGAAARVGDLSPAEVARIQAAAEQLGADIYVVGSAAKGTRRNVGSDLPLARFGEGKAGTRSDIDYAVRSGLDDRANTLRLPDVDSSWGVRGVDYLNLDRSPAIRFSPGKAPETISGGGRLYLDGRPR